MRAPVPGIRHGQSLQCGQYLTCHCSWCFRSFESRRTCASPACGGSRHSLVSRDGCRRLGRSLPWRRSRMCRRRRRYRMGRMVEQDCQCLLGFRKNCIVRAWPLNLMRANSKPDVREGNVLLAIAAQSIVFPKFLREINVRIVAVHQSVTTYSSRAEVVDLRSRVRSSWVGHSERSSVLSQKPQQVTVFVDCQLAFRAFFIRRTYLARRMGCLQGSRRRKSVSTRCVTAAFASLLSMCDSKLASCISITTAPASSDSPEPTIGSSKQISGPLRKSSKVASRVAL